MCNSFTANVFAFSWKSVEQFSRAFFLCEPNLMSLPLYNTLEICVFSITTHPKLVLFNAVGTYAGVVYFLNRYVTLMLQPSNQVSWETEKEELLFPLLAAEVISMPALGWEWLWHVSAHKELMIWEEKVMDSILGDKIWASHCTEHLISFTSYPPNNPKG